MTGFAMVRVQTAAGDLTVTLRSVNHRALDLHFHQNGQLAQFENAMRGLLKQQLRRGHIEVRVAFAHDGQPESFAYNRDMLERYLISFQQACQDFGLDTKPDLNAFFALPGVLETGRESKVLDKSSEPAVLGALLACINELNNYREREGRELFNEFQKQIAAIEEKAAQIAAIRSEAVPHFRERLRERLSDLLQLASLSESRLLEEAALLADRSDVQEELARLTVHNGELSRIFETGGEIGKRIDFLLQEMNREINTLLSKTSGIGEPGLRITDLALDIKVNIERMREQALNLE